MTEATPTPATLTRAEFYPRMAAYMQSQQPEFNVETLESIFNLAFTYDAFATHFNRRLKRMGLSFPGFNLLMILNSPIYRESGCPLSQLGELLLVSKANITGVMDSLVKRGLAERADATYDRRVKLGRVTGQGKDLIASILPGHFRETKRVTAGLTSQEKLQLRDLLKKLRQSVAEAGEEPDDKD